MRTPPGITQLSRSDFAVVCSIHGTLLLLLPAIREVGVCGMSALDDQPQGRALLSSLAKWSYAQGIRHAKPSAFGEMEEPDRVW